MDIFYWVSIVLMWVATGLNVAGVVRNLRQDKRLDELCVLYENEIAEFRTENARMKEMRVSDE